MKRPVIGGMLAGVITLVAAHAFAQGPGGLGGPAGPPPPPMHAAIGMPGPMAMHGPMHGPMMPRMISEDLDRALDRASATPEQRVKIYAARDRVFGALDAQRPDPLAQRDRMLTLFEADQPTTANLDALHQQLEQQHQAVRQAIHCAIVETHDALSPAQRKVVAEYLRSHGPGLFAGMHRPDGPHGPGGPRGPAGGPPDAPGMR